MRAFAVRQPSSPPTRRSGEDGQTDRPNRAAILLFTRGPAAEAGRKRLLGDPARGHELLGNVLERILHEAATVPGADLLVAAPISLPSCVRAGVVRRLTQSGSTFGERLRSALTEAFALGYDRVVVIGDDAPGVSASDLKRALGMLEGAGPRAALGPSPDGGFYLLGLNGFAPSVLDEIPWCSRRTASVTEARLRRAGFRVARIRSLPDLDDARGVEALAGRLRRAPCGALRALAALARRLLREAAEILLPRDPLPSHLASRAVPLLRGPPLLHRPH